MVLQDAYNRYELLIKQKNEEREKDRSIFKKQIKQFEKEEQERKKKKIEDCKMQKEFLDD